MYASLGLNELNPWQIKIATLLAIKHTHISAVTLTMFESKVSLLEIAIKRLELFVKHQAKLTQR